LPVKIFLQGGSLIVGQECFCFASLRQDGLDSRNLAQKIAAAKSYCLRPQVAWGVIGHGALGSALEIRAETRLFPDAP
jgi:hypothetical protein